MTPMHGPLASARQSRHPPAPMQRQGVEQSVGGKRVVLAVIALAVLLTAGIVVQAVLTDRTGITRRGLTPVPGADAAAAP
jgi:hypothetical protein